MVNLRLGVGELSAEESGGGVMNYEASHDRIFGCEEIREGKLDWVLSWNVDFSGRLFVADRLARFSNMDLNFLPRGIRYPF